MALSPHTARRAARNTNWSNLTPEGTYPEELAPCPSPMFARAHPKGMRTPSSENLNLKSANPVRKTIGHYRIEDLLNFQQKYNISDVLGEGSFGMVHQVSDRKKGEVFACKEVQKDKAGTSGIRMLELEIAVLKRLDHMHIVALKEVYETPKQTFLVMELCSGGNLEELHKNKKGEPAFSLSQTQTIMRRVVRAIAYLHSEGVVHRDMKLENVMVKTLHKLDIKICDFGLCALDGNDSQISDVCGTPSYMAPEVLENLGQYSPLCDLWSLGVMAYVLITAKLPFKATDRIPTVLDVIRRTDQGELLRRHSRLDDKIVQSALRKLLEVDPPRRMTAKELLDHPFISPKSDTLRSTFDADNLTVLEMMKQFAVEQTQSLPASPISPDPSKSFTLSPHSADRSSVASPISRSVSSKGNSPRIRPGTEYGHRTGHRFERTTTKRLSQPSVVSPMTSPRAASRGRPSIQTNSQMRRPQSRTLSEPLPSLQVRLPPLNKSKRY